MIDALTTSTALAAALGALAAFGLVGIAVVVSAIGDILRHTRMIRHDRQARTRGGSDVR